MKYDSGEDMWYSDASMPRDFVMRNRMATLAHSYGGIDGDHHKQWLIDQMLRVALGDEYDDWVAVMNIDEEYEPWDEGIAP